MGGRSNLNFPKPVPFVFFVRAFGREKNTLTITTTRGCPTSRFGRRTMDSLKVAGQKLPETMLQMVVKQNCALPLCGRILHKKVIPKKTNKTNGKTPSRPYTNDAQVVQFFENISPQWIGGNTWKQYLKPLLQELVVRFPSMSTRGAPEPTVKNGVIYHPYKWPYKRVIGAISSL